MNIPSSISKIDESIESNLPILWFLNYGNIFNNENKRKYQKKSPPPSQALNIPPPSLNQPPKKGKNPNQQLNQNTGKKPWNCPEFIKLYKKFEELTTKPIEEPKEE